MNLLKNFIQGAIYLLHLIRIHALRYGVTENTPSYVIHQIKGCANNTKLRIKKYNFLTYELQSLKIPKSFSDFTSKIFLNLIF